MLPGGEAKGLADVHVDYLYMLEEPENPREGCKPSLLFG